MSENIELDDPLQGLQLLRKAWVLQFTSLSSATLARRVKDGSFPKPVQISPNRVAWRSVAVSEWLKHRE